MTMKKTSENERLDTSRICQNLSLKITQLVNTAKADLSANSHLLSPEVSITLEELLSQAGELRRLTGDEPTL